MSANARIQALDGTVQYYFSLQFCEFVIKETFLLYVLLLYRGYFFFDNSKREEMGLGSRVEGWGQRRER